MVRYRRFLTDNPDEIYFLTLVTKNRHHYYKTYEDYSKLWLMLDVCFSNDNGKIEAFVFLPDHMHLLITQGNTPFSKRVASFKIKTNFKFTGKQQTLWQKRFWEHKIRTMDEYRIYADYIHWNPVKHGHVTSTRDWCYSSFQQFVQQGHYTEDWFSNEDFTAISNAGE